MSTMSDHYRTHHYGKPHEHLVSGINPLSQQKETPKNTTAYTIFYIVLGLAAVLLGLVIWGVYRDYKKKHDDRHREKDKQKKIKEKENLQQIFDAQQNEGKKKAKIYPDVKIHPEKHDYEKAYSNNNEAKSSGIGSRGNSTPSMTTSASEVQPPPEFPYHERGYNYRARRSAANITTITVEQQQQNKSIAKEVRDDFGKFNEHHTKKESVEEFGPEGQGGQGPMGWSYNSGMGTSAESRRESFPFAYYGMPPEDRQPRAARVENLRPMSDFFKLSPGESFMVEEDENEEATSTASASGNNSSGDERNYAFGNSDTLPINRDPEY